MCIKSYVLFILGALELYINLECSPFVTQLMGCGENQDGNLESLSCMVTGGLRQGQNGSGGNPRGEMPEQHLRLVGYHV